MPGFLEEADLLFGTSNLYKILNVAEKASKAEIKKAYYKVSLAVHPDKCEENEREFATRKFQVLGKSYAILTDKNLRAAYDETGSVDEDDCEPFKAEDWLAYWRRCFPKVSLEDIKKVEMSYKGSEEEKKDLVKSYQKNKGDMDAILNDVMCSTVEDEPRFRGILEELIASGELESYDLFTNEEPKRKKSRRNWYNKEAQEAEEMLEKLKKKNNVAEGEDSLRSLIAGNMRSRGSAWDKHLAEMESRYSPKRKNAKTARTTRAKGGK